MSTDDADRQLGEPITPTEPKDESDDAIGTPAASIEAFATPTEVDLAVEAIGEDTVALRIDSVTISGKVILDTEPAADLRDDVAEAIEAAENWEVDE